MYLSSASYVIGRIAASRWTIAFVAFCAGVVVATYSPRTAGIAEKIVSAFSAVITFWRIGD
jgi:hypothetical protein